VTALQRLVDIGIALVDGLPDACWAGDMHWELAFSQLQCALEQSEAVVIFRHVADVPQTTVVPADAATVKHRGDAALHASVVINVEHSATSTQPLFVNVQRSAAEAHCSLLNDLQPVKSTQCASLALVPVNKQSIRDAQACGSNEVQVAGVTAPAAALDRSPTTTTTMRGDRGTEPQLAAAKERR
jgi:hypothetical protein